MKFFHILYRKSEFSLKVPDVKFIAKTFFCWSNLYISSTDILSVANPEILNKKSLSRKSFHKILILLYFLTALCDLTVQTLASIAYWNAAVPRLILTMISLINKLCITYQWQNYRANLLELNTLENNISVSFNKVKLAFCHMWNKQDSWRLTVKITLHITRVKVV